MNVHQSTVLHLLRHRHLRPLFLPMHLPCNLLAREDEALSVDMMMMMMNVIYNYIVKAAAGCIPGGNNYSSQSARAR